MSPSRPSTPETTQQPEWTEFLAAPRRSRDIDTSKERVLTLIASHKAQCLALMKRWPHAPSKRPLKCPSVAWNGLVKLEHEIGRIPDKVWQEETIHAENALREMLRVIGRLD